MALAATIDNFTNLTTNPWTVSGITASGNQVSATTGGSWGTIKLTHGPVSPNGDEARIAFDLIPDKNDTAGRMIFCGQTSNSAADQGMVAGYIAGTGIVAFLTFNQGVSGSADIAVADANVIDGHRYHIEVFYKPKYHASADTWQIIIQVYDEDFNFVGGVRESASLAAWMSFDNVTIGGTSSTSKISRFAFEPGPAGWFPSSTTSPYMRASCMGFREVGTIDVGDANHKFGLYIPGTLRSNPPVVCLHFHGSGSWSPSTPVGSGAGNSWDRATPNHMSTITFHMLDAGIPVVAPSTFSDDSSSQDSWGSTTAYQEVKDIVGWVNSHLGSDTRYLIYGFSMGGLMACRVIQQGEIPNIEGVILHNAVTGLFNAWNTGVWQTSLENAWGIAPADAAEAHNELDPYDPHLVVLAQPDHWRGKHITVLSSTADGTVSPASHSDILTAALTSVDITHTHIQLPFGSHTDTLPPSAAGNFISNALRRSFDLEIGSMESRIASPVDGLSLASFREALLAYIAGESVVIDNGDGTKTISYKKQDRSTDKLTIRFNNSGEFTQTTVN